MKESKPGSTTTLLVIVAMALALFLPLAIPGTANASTQVSEYPVPSAGSQPYGITAGPDGNLWFTEGYGNKIGRLTTSGSITEYPIPSAMSGPRGITAGPDGNLWFTEMGGGRIGKVTKSGSITEYAVPTSSSGAYGITAGPDGNLWFTENWSNKIGKVTTSGSFTEYSVPTSSSLLMDIAVGPDGNLWFAEWHGNKIGKITTSGSVTEYTVPTSTSYPYGITTGPDGNLWFSENGGNKIGRLTTSGSITEFPIPTSNSQPCGITAGPDGNLWFTEGGGNKISRITTSGSITEYAIPTPNSVTYEIAAGPDGNLWFSEWNSNKMGRVKIPSTFYFAEGTCRPNFDPYFCIQNPGNSAAGVKLTYMKGDGTSATDKVTIPAGARATVNPRDKLGTGNDAAHDFSTKITCTNGQQIVAERPMYFDYNGWTGGHDVVGATYPASTFYFAEGTCRPGFSPYFCIQNPWNYSANVTLTYLKGDGTSATDSVTVPAGTRATVNPGDKLGSGDDAAHDFSTKVTCTNGRVICERPMYFDYNGWTGGSDVMGASAMSRNWYFAEGTTRDNFTEYVTVLNPNKTEAAVKFDYMIEGAGEKSFQEQVPAGSRATFNAADSIGNNKDASLKVTSDQFVVVERPMYFNYLGLSNDNWNGGHCVMGATAPSAVWYFAEGYTGANFEEWLCMQNPNNSDITVRATYTFGPGEGAQVTKSYAVKALQRLTVSVPKEVGLGKDVSVKLETPDHARVFVAERPMYFNYQGAWTGGHDVVGFTRSP